MTMMKAVVKQGSGYGEIDLEERPIPEIDDFDILVRVKAAGLCGSDVNSYRGRKTTAQPGTILGHEFSGEIAKVGSKVTRWKIGDRVVSDNTGYVCGVCSACASGEFLLCEKRKGIGSAMDGGFADYVKIPGEVLSVFPNALMKIPDNVSYEEAAILDPYANAYNSIIQQGHMMPGDIILITGAGPLALACIDIARVAGSSRIIVLVRSSTAQMNREAAIKLGATDILEADKDDYVQFVKDITDGEGIPIAVDTAGANSMFKPIVELLQKGGKFVKIGYDWNPLPESLVEMTHRNIYLIGHFGYNPISWLKVLALLKAEKLHPGYAITEEVPLDKFHYAVQKVLDRKAIKMVFKF